MWPYCGSRNKSLASNSIRSTLASSVSAQQVSSVITMANRFAGECRQSWATLGGSPRLRLEKTGDDFILQRPQGVYTGKLRPRSIRIVRETDNADAEDKSPASLRTKSHWPEKTNGKAPLRSSLTIEDLKKEVEDLGSDIEEGFASLFPGAQ